MTPKESSSLIEREKQLLDKGATLNQVETDLAKRGMVDRKERMAALKNLEAQQSHKTDPKRRGSIFYIAMVVLLIAAIFLVTRFFN